MAFNNGISGGNTYKHINAHIYTYIETHTQPADLFARICLFAAQLNALMAIKVLSLWEQGINRKKLKIKEQKKIENQKRFVRRQPSGY